ncbi:MAG: YceD family protein [Chitinophagales bacterium]|nr:DUF177 domain-containing protein [Bacteroidota bacterium]
MSDSLQEYYLPHAGLKKGVHEFTYELTEKFFSNFEDALIEKCDVQVNVTLDNRQEPLVIELDFDGTIWSECDRCTAPIPLSIHTSQIVYVKYKMDEDWRADDDREIIFVARDDQYLDITSLFYDIIHVSIPVHRVCDKPGETEYCDKEIVNILEKKQENKKADPRWEGLNKLKDNLN